MEQDARHRADRKHLLTDEQLASHAGVSADDLSRIHRQGNGIRIHRTYIVIVSLAALVLLGVAIAVASTTM
jgi:hypothetical protein